MSLNTFFGYFGGKWEPARRYPPPLHDTIIEPFAGSAGYSVRHHRRKVILVEKDPEIAALWRYLIKVSARELLALPDLPSGGSLDDVRVHPEARSLIQRNIGRGNSTVQKRFSTWDLVYPHSVWGPTMRARLAAQVEKIRHWRVIEGDYTLAPDVRATWYVDPPYQTMGKHYRCGSADIDFAKLGAWCRSRQGQVMVCEQAPAAWLPFRKLGTVRSAHRGAGPVFSHEVIWTND